MASSTAAPPIGGGCTAASACTLLGAWHTHSAPWNGESTDSVITFAADCSFTGQPTYAGYYGIDGTTLAILSTTGQDMTCSASDTFTLSFSGDCETATMAGIGSECTGARKYLDWSVTLTRD